jgi:hypothetical protein
MELLPTIALVITLSVGEHKRTWWIPLAHMTLAQCEEHKSDPNQWWARLSSNAKIKCERAFPV